MKLNKRAAIIVLNAILFVTAFVVIYYSFKADPMMTTIAINFAQLS